MHKIEVFELDKLLELIYSNYGNYVFREIYEERINSLVIYYISEVVEQLTFRL